MCMVIPGGGMGRFDRAQWEQRAAIGRVRREVQAAQQLRPPRHAHAQSMLAVCSAHTSDALFALREWRLSSAGGGAELGLRDMCLRHDHGALRVTHPRAASRLLISFLIFHISMLASWLSSSLLDMARGELSARAAPSAAAPSTPASAAYLSALTPAASSLERRSLLSSPAA